MSELTSVELDEGLRTDRDDGFNPDGRPETDDELADLELRPDNCAAE